MRGVGTEWQRLVGHFANLEAQRSFLQGSWHLCTPSLTPYAFKTCLISYFFVKINCFLKLYYSNILFLYIYFIVCKEIFFISIYGKNNIS